MRYYLVCYCLWGGRRDEKFHHIIEPLKHQTTSNEIPFHILQNEAQSSDDSLSSLSETSFNYINSIVGSGVIGIPYALARAGYGVGLLLLVFVAIITDYSLRLMVNKSTLIKSLIVICNQIFQNFCLESRRLITFPPSSFPFSLKIFMQIKTAHLSGSHSYPSVMESAFGSGGYYLLSFLQFLYPFLGKN